MSRLGSKTHSHWRNFRRFALIKRQGSIQDALSPPTRDRWISLRLGHHCLAHANGGGGVRQNVYGAGRQADCVPPPNDATKPDRQNRSEIRHAGEDHWDAVELAYGSERFTVRFDVTPNASPSVKGLSWKGSKAPGVDWNKRRADSDNVETPIYDGPLAELALSSDPCR